MSGGAPTAADAASPDQPQPLSVRLMSRGSFAGAAIVAAIALAYALLLPVIARATSEPAPPRVVEIGGGATIEATEAWSAADPIAGYTTLTQAGSTLIITEPRPTARQPAEATAAIASSWVADAPETAVATEPREFTTEAGDDAATSIVQEPLQTSQAWVVSNGTSEVILVLTAPSTSWESASNSAQVLVRSLTFAEDAP